MELIYSQPWVRKKRYRSDISDYMIEFALMNSDELRDRKWEDVSNAICRIPPMGRILKVVYKKVGERTYRIITAYWLD